MSPTVDQEEIILLGLSPEQRVTTFSPYDLLLFHFVRTPLLIVTDERRNTLHRISSNHSSGLAVSNFKEMENNQRHGGSVMLLTLRRLLPPT